MNQLEFNLFSDSEEPKIKIQNPILNNQEQSLLSIYLQNAILGLLTIGKTSSREICEILITNHKAPKERYLSDKPKIYPVVCMYLDSLVLKGELELVNVHERDERLYKLLKK